MALTETEPGQLNLTVSEFDTDDGISITVVGEAFPRVRLSSAGLATGDGTQEPVALADPTELAAVLDDFETRIAALEV